MLQHGKAKQRHIGLIWKWTDTLKAEQPAVPWREISGFRNILGHNYLGDIDPDTVAAVVDKYLEPLAQAVDTMLRKL